MSNYCHCLYSYLEFLKGEATSQADLEVVAVGWAVDYRTERSSHRTREDGLSLRLTCLTSAYLAGRLVEPSTYTLVPILSKVIVDGHIVVLYHGEEAGTVLPVRMGVTDKEALGKPLILFASFLGDFFSHNSHVPCVVE